MSDQEMRQLGLRVTAPRQKILKVLSESEKRHLSAEEIYRALTEQKEEVGLATVYRVLHQFERAGLVNKHQFDTDMAVYEIDDGQHHDHLVCVRCGQVQEFFDQVIEQRQRMVAEQSGYTLTDHQLNLYGMCGRCQKDEA